MEYKEIVRAALKKVGMTYIQASEATGYSEFSINSWANGKHKPSFIAIEDICNLANFRIAIIDEEGNEVK